MIQLEPHEVRETRPRATASRRTRLRPRRRVSWRDDLRRFVAATLIGPLAALGCARLEPSGSEPDETIGEQASVTESEYQNLVNSIAFDPDYVALQQRSIQLTARILPRAAVMTAQELALLHSDNVTQAQVMALSGLTSQDLSQVAQLGATVRARFPWIKTHGVDLHRLATLTNPQLYAAYEGALSSVPALDVASRNPASRAERAAAARAFLLAEASRKTQGGTEADPPPDSEDDGPPGYCCWAGDIAGILAGLAPIAIIIVAMAINPEFGALVALVILVAYAVAFVAAFISQVWDVVVDWFEDAAETLDESFGHDDDECSDDGDCPSSQYCDNGDVLGGIFGTNECEPDKSEGEGCWQDSECQSGCCKFNWGRVQCRPSDKCD
jgi:hypothetical protein